MKCLSKNSAHVSPTLSGCCGLLPMLIRLVDKIGNAAIEKLCSGSIGKAGLWIPLVTGWMS